MRFWLTVLVGACVVAAGLLVLAVAGAWLDGRYGRVPPGD